MWHQCSDTIHVTVFMPIPFVDRIFIYPEHALSHLILLTALR